MSTYSYDRTAALTPRDPLDKVVKQLRDASTRLNMLSSIPASAANTLERNEKAGIRGGWAAMGEGEKKKALELIQTFTDAVKEADGKGHKLWRHMERL